MSSHPNATASAFTTFLGAVVYKYAHQFGWVNFTPEDGIAAVGAVVTAVLFVGRRGIWPTVKAVVMGAASGVKPAPAPPEPPVA